MRPPGRDTDQTSQFSSPQDATSTNRRVFRTQLAVRPREIGSPEHLTDRIVFASLHDATLIKRRVFRTRPAARPRAIGSPEHCVSGCDETPTNRGDLASPGDETLTNRRGFAFPSDAILTKYRVFRTRPAARPREIGSPEHCVS